MQDTFKYIVGGLTIALLTLTFSNMDDRYRASEAERDLRQIRAEITLSETRMKESIMHHGSSGPHDDVAERLVRIESRYEVILEEIKNIRRVLEENSR